jgi:trigger factor
MSYTVETLNGCTKKFVFNYEDVDLSNQVNQAINKKQKDSSLKGFRKGKAPISMIKQVYGPQIEADALYKFISDEFLNAVKKEDLKVIGSPSFSVNNNEDKKVSFDAVIEIFPEFVIKDLAGLSFEKEKMPDIEAEVETMKKRMLDSKAETKEITDENASLENGHCAVMNFEGEMPDGSKPENMKGKEHLLEIGSAQFIPGFEEKMIGMKKNEMKTIDITFPEDYHAEDLKGVAVKFHIELLEIKEKVSPEFNDELIKTMGHESTEAFYTKTREQVSYQKNREVTEKLHQEILEKLVEMNEFDLPKAFIKTQEESYKNELKQNLTQQGFDDNMVLEYFTKWEADISSKAAFQVRTGLIMDKLAQVHEIETNEEDLKAKMDEMAKYSGLPMDQVLSYYEKNEQLKNSLKYAIREEKTFEKIKSIVKISEKK